jgi:hypothetical protein
MTDATIEAVRRQPDLHAEQVIVTGEMQSHTFGGPIPVYEGDEHWTILVHDGMEYVTRGDVVTAQNSQRGVRRGRVNDLSVDVTGDFTYIQTRGQL